MAKAIAKRSTTGKPPAPRPAPRPKPAAPPPAELVVHDDVEQDTDEWRRLRLGLVTASELGTVMAQSEEMLTRTKLLRQLAGEILTEEPKSDFSNRYTERGKALEPEARAYYQRRTFTDVRRVGFVYNPDLDCGWSPDGLIGDDGALEIKCVEPHILIGILDRGVFPPEHRPQCHGALFIGRRKWLDLLIYSHPSMPKFVARLEPDPVYHREIWNEVQRFQWELKSLVEKLKKMGK